MEVKIREIREIRGSILSEREFNIASAEFQNTF
jgi:hypothetical protein